MNADHSECTIADGLFLNAQLAKIALAYPLACDIYKIKGESDHSANSNEHKKWTACSLIVHSIVSKVKQYADTCDGEKNLFHVDVVSDKVFPNLEKKQSFFSEWNI
jgi:hypothetical protein